MRTLCIVCILLTTSVSSAQVFENRRDATELNASVGLYAVDITLGSKYLLTSSFDPEVFSNGGYHELEFITYNVDILVPVFSDSDIKLLIGASVSDSRDYASNYTGTLYSNGDALTVYSNSSVYGGGAYAGLSIDKFIINGRVFAAGFFAKAALSYCVFEQQLTITETMRVAAANGHYTSRHSQQIITSSGVGGKFVAGVSASVAGIRLRPGFAAFASGSHGDGMVVALGIDFGIGFAF
jgi:hypothetical protein